MRGSGSVQKMFVDAVLLRAAMVNGETIAHYTLPNGQVVEIVYQQGGAKCLRILRIALSRPCGADDTIHRDMIAEIGEPAPSTG